MIDIGNFNCIFSLTGDIGRQGIPGVQGPKGPEGPRSQMGEKGKVFLVLKPEWQNNTCKRWLRDI